MKKQKQILETLKKKDYFLRFRKDWDQKVKFVFNKTGSCSFEELVSTDTQLAEQLATDSLEITPNV